TVTGSILRVGQVDGSTSVAHLTVSSGFTNNGSIELTTTFAAAFSAQLTMTSGTLTNAAGATISALPGTTARGTRSLDAQIDNQGTITALVPMSIAQPSSAHTNSGTIDLTAGGLAVTQNGVSPSFTNTGTITVGLGQTFSIAGGTFTQNAGSLG